MIKHFKIMRYAFLSNQSRFLSESPISKESQGSETTSCEGQPEVVSFRRFIPLHVAFLNQPATPNYLENVFTNKKGNYDVQLGCDLKNILKMFINKGKDEKAANILRNIICSGFLMDTAAVNEMKDTFINSLHTEFQNNTLNYLDILIYFIGNEKQIDMDVSDKNTLVFQLFKDSLNKALSRNSELIHRDRLEDKIYETSKKLTQYDNSAALSDLFHFEVAKTVIKRKQFELLHFVNFACLSNDHAARIISKLIIYKCYSEAIDLMIKSDAQVDEHIVFGLYKRVTDLKAKGSFKVSDEKLTTFENWICDNEFDDVMEEIGTVRKGRMENKSYDWNELDLMK